MDGFLRALFSLIAALNAATGAPIDANNMPDRPPIIAPTMEHIPRTLPKATAATTEPIAATTAITGTIASMKDGVIVVNGQSIALSSSTQIKGQVKTGASVSVVVKVKPDGALEAERLDVSTDATAAGGTTTPTEQASTSPVTTGTPGAGTGTPGAGMTQTPGVGSTGTPEPKSTEQAKTSPTANPTAQVTEQTKTNPTPVPQVQPTEQTQANPTEAPQPTENSNDNATPTGSTPTSDSGSSD